MVQIWLRKGLWPCQEMCLLHTGKLADQSLCLQHPGCCLNTWFVLPVLFRVKPRVLPLGCVPLHCLVDVHPGCACAWLSCQGCTKRSVFMS